MEVSFKANKLDSVNVMKRGVFSYKYSPQSVSLVEFNLRSVEDKKALKKLKKHWPLTFMSDIYSHVRKKSVGAVYAITKQNDNFEKIDHKQVLGVMEVTHLKPQNYAIEYLQVHPDFMYSEGKSSRIKGIGHSLVDFLKTRETVSHIEANADFTALPFYEKEGFKCSSYDPGKVVWSKT